MDFYIVLASNAARRGRIKRAYKRLARRLHPDINPGDREAAARFRQVLDAYETLMDPDRRRRYDAGQLSSAGADDESETFGFAGFDFSSRVHAERTTTFGDLFEEVLSRRAARPAEGAEHGADIHARTQLTSKKRGAACSGRSPSRGRTPAAPARAAAFSASPKPAACRARAPARCARSAATWCLRRPARRAAGKGA